MFLTSLVITLLSLSVSFSRCILKISDIEFLVSVVIEIKCESSVTAVISQLIGIYEDVRKVLPCGPIDEMDVGEYPDALAARETLCTCCFQ